MIFFKRKYKRWMSLESANLQDWLVNHGITLQPDFVTKTPPYAPAVSHERTYVPN